MLDCKVISWNAYEQWHSIDCWRIQLTCVQLQWVCWVHLDLPAEDEVMESFNVVSLFMCSNWPYIPGCMQQTGEWSHPLREEKVMVDDIVSLLTLCLKATYLEFRRMVYQQIHGTAMGFIVSIMIANLVMGMLNRELSLPIISLPASGKTTWMTFSQPTPTTQLV